MATVEEIIATARTLIGTPYAHQGRLPGVALDCIGVPIVICQVLWLGNFDIQGYSREPDGTLLERIDEICSRTNKLEVGVMAVFKIREEPQHVGIVGENEFGLTLIHAYQGAGKVCEHQLDKKWCDRIVGLYQLPGADYK